MSANDFSTSLSEWDDTAIWRTMPHVDGAKFFRNGEVVPYRGTCVEVSSPIINKATGKRIIIGRLAQNSVEDAELAFEAAKQAWRCGTGEWPQMRLEDRISSINRFVTELKLKRDEIINVLMWEICKSAVDATLEFDRTILYIEDTISSLRRSEETEGKYYTTVSGITARVRRNGVGVMVLLGPFNYPFNETYSTLIPALLMGNTVVMKIPTVGGLSHMLTMDAFAETLPRGVVNFISGPGRKTIAPVMRRGPDLLAFIGGSKAADAITREHPYPHRLRVYTSLEGKNIGIITPDADLRNAARECCIGATSYNGQRCTAIKMMFVHTSISRLFLHNFVNEVNALVAGLPWETGISITPLPHPDRIPLLTSLIDDATSKGAEVINAYEGGGYICGNLMRPAIVYPVTESMSLWTEEQMGPVIPVAVYDDIEEVYDYIMKTHYGLQASIFCNDPATTAGLIDVLSTSVGRININCQCSRSPDVLPFTGRRSSGLGTISISEAVNNFSVRTVVSFRHNEANMKLIKAAEQTSTFLAHTGTVDSLKQSQEGTVQR